MMSRTNKSVLRSNRALVDKSTITTLSFRDEMMSRGTETEKPTSDRNRFEKKQLPTRNYVEDSEREGNSCRFSAENATSRAMEQPREIQFSPVKKSVKQSYCSNDLKSPTSAMNDWSIGDLKPFDPQSNLNEGTTRSTVRRTHSAPQDIIPNQPPRRQRPSRRFSRPMIEILSGQSMPLIGFAESKHYFRQGNCTRTSCVECTMSLYCAMDASFMLCTICESISPIRHGEQENPLLGFGITMDQISE